MSQYFTKPYRSHGGDIKVKLYLSNYATKTDLKNVTHVDVSSLASKTNLASLKTEVDKLDIPKLSTVPADLVKLSNVVKNDVVKKTEYNSLKTKVDSIDTINFVSRTKHEKDGSDFEDKISKIDNKIPDVSDLVKKKTDFNAKVPEIEGNIPSISRVLRINTINSKVSDLEKNMKTAESKPDISNFTNKTELKNVENKIPDTNGFIKLTDYSSEITKIKNDYVSNTSLSSQLNDLKSQHIADEVKKIDDKTKKNSPDILGLESRLKQKEDTLNDLEREASFFREIIIITNSLI